MNVIQTTFLTKYDLTSTDITPLDYEIVGHSLFAIGRFFTALIQYYIKPRWVLLMLYIGLIVTSALAMNLKGTAGLAMALLIYLFESGIFSTIFAISLRGAGRHTKTAGAIMTATVCSGAIFPFVQSPVEDKRGIAYSFCVLVALYAAGAIFPIYLNLLPTAKRQVDPVQDEHLRRRRRSHITGPNSSRPHSCPVNQAHTGETINSPSKDVPRYRRKFGHPFSKLTKPEQSHRGSGKYTADNSGSSESNGDQPGGGGIMHDLVPWPSPMSPPPSTEG
jgi:hypothetical protein